MRFLITIVWAALISGVFSYVLSNMAGGSFNLAHSLVLAGVVVLAVIVLGEGVLKENNEQ